MYKAKKGSGTSHAIGLTLLCVAVAILLGIFVILLIILDALQLSLGLRHPHLQ